jgi:hypothetical protein
MIYIIVAAKQIKNKTYSDTYIFLYYGFTEKIATTWIPQILHSYADTKIKCFKNINNTEMFQIMACYNKHKLL